MRETAKFVFAFTTYSQTAKQQEWEAHGVVDYEEIEWLKLKYIKIHFSARKRTNQVQDVLDELHIKTHKLGSEPNEITSFNVKDTMQGSVVYGMLQRHKNSDTYKKWTTPKELGMDVSYPAKADGKRKREPVNRFQVPDERPFTRAKASAAVNYDTEPDSACGSQEQIPVIQAVVQAAPVVEPVVLAAPAVEPVVLAAPAVEPVVQAAPAVEPVVQAVWIPSPETNLEAEVEKLRAILAERDRLVEAQSKHIADKENQLAEKNTQLIDKAKQMQALASAFCGVGV